MVKQQTPTFERSDLAREFEKAFYSTVQKSTNFQPPDVLVSLTRLLIKPKRIGHAIKKSPAIVRDMITGKQKCPVRYWPELYALLRLAVEVAKQHVADAERKTILWGSIPYPPEVLEMFHTRIREAEEVLSRAEEVITKEAQQ